jgi:hypothetical protein
MYVLTVHDRCGLCNVDQTINDKKKQAQKQTQKTLREGRKKGKTMKEYVGSDIKTQKMEGTFG